MAAVRAGMGRESAHPVDLRARWRRRWPCEHGAGPTCWTGWRRSAMTLGLNAGGRAGRQEGIAGAAGDQVVMVAMVDAGEPLPGRG